MTKAALFIAGVLMTGAAWAQESKPSAADDKSKAAPPPQRPLNLKLDNPARYTREEPTKKAEDSLPSLGGGGSPLFERAAEPARTERPSPYPKDTENTR
jgi:hypothetical protein